MGHVLPEIERRMRADFPDKLREHRATAEAHAAAMERWKQDVREASKHSAAPPLPPEIDAPEEPQEPRLRQTDLTIERVATLLATATPKGLLMRDELPGWLSGMNAYNEAGRAFSIEAYGGRPYRAERQKHPRPIDIPRLTVAVFGTAQPDRLAELMRGADDRLLARFVWFWPDTDPFDLSRAAPNADWAIAALDKLRLLELAPALEPGGATGPIPVPLADPARARMVDFGRET